MEQVLTGYRVLDFGHYIAGPYTGMLLAEQGAEVIKVEGPGGDPHRNNPGFVVWNRSKKGITLDLKKEEGQKIALDLAKHADVIVENFSPGVTERLGIDYEAIRQINPGAVYCSISGYGQSGPYRDRPGWDPLVASTVAVYVEQGGGLESEPLYLVLPLPSYYTAFMAAFNIATALLAKELTGKGQWIDISILNGIMSAASGMFVDFPERIRIARYNPQGSSPLYRLYQGSDGKWFFLGLGNLTFFAKFAIAMEHEEWLTDPRFEGAPFVILPPVNEEIIAEFQEIFLTKTGDEWLEFLRSNDIPCAPAQPVENFLTDPQIIANEMVTEVEEPRLGKVRQMGIPLKMGLGPGKIKGRSPKQGEHTEEVLKDLLHYPQEEIGRLKRLKVF